MSGLPSSPDELFGPSAPSAVAPPQQTGPLPTSPEELFAPKPTTLQNIGGFVSAPVNIGAAAFADWTRPNDTTHPNGTAQLSTPALDTFFSKTPAGRILKAFGHGAAYPFQVWNDATNPDNNPDTAGFLKNAGVFDTLEKNRSITSKNFVDLTLRGLATTADAVLNAVKENPFTEPGIIASKIGYGTGVSGAFEQLRQDLLGSAPDLRKFANDTVWGRIKQDFTAQMTAGKVPLDAFGAALSLTGIPQLVSKATELYGKGVASGLTTILPTKPGMETQEQLAARATADANFAAMFAGPPGEGAILSPALASRLNAAREAGVIGAGETPADIAADIRQHTQTAEVQAREAGAPKPPEGAPTGTPPQDLTPSPPPLASVLQTPSDTGRIMRGTPGSSPLDIEGAARQMAPDVFDRYDALANRHQWFNNWIAEMQRARDANVDPRLPPLDTEIETILGKVHGVESKLTNKAASRLEEVRALRDQVARTGQPDTADMASIKEAMLKNYNEMQALSPAMRDARNASRARMPLADLHEADAEQSAPEDAADAAARNTVENDTYAKEHAPEVHDEINAGQSGGVATPDTGLPSSTNEAGPTAGQTGETSNSGTVADGDNTPVAEGGTARTQPEGKPRTIPARGSVTFKTAKGSTYEVHEDGTTTRNKAARSDVGHEGDSGVKARTVKTVYVASPEDASQLSAAGLQGLGPKGARVIIKDGKASLLTWNEKAGKWGISPGQRDIPVSSEPGIGKAPLELWKPADDVPGHEAYANMHAGNAITEVSGGSRPVGLRPVSGSGEIKPRGLALHVEEKAIEDRLTEGFGDLPEYRVLSMADQAKRAVDLIDADPEFAREIAMGTKKPPRGLLPESVFVAVEKVALAEGDVETLRQLATASHLTTEATTMGQRIRTLGERDPTSPVAAIKAVQDAREAVAKARGTPDVKIATNAAVDDMKAEIKASAPTKEAWGSFIEAITCK